jgi:hypothetical protein
VVVVVPLTGIGGGGLHLGRLVLPLTGELLLLLDATAVASPLSLILPVALTLVWLVIAGLATLTGLKAPLARVALRRLAVATAVRIV